MQKIKEYLPLAIKYFLFAIALTPIIYTGQKTLYPFIFGKIIFFRSLVEISFLFCLAYFILKIANKETLDFQKFRTFLKNPLIILFGVFLFSAVLSTVFAFDRYTAFWGTLERGGGLFGFLHYFIFLSLAVIFFKKKDWLIFFKISLIVGFVALFYGFLQYFNVKEFPFSLEQASRPGSFVGNPSFLSAYLFFVIASAVLVFNLTKNLFWRSVSVLLILLSTAMIFLAATRGALLGFAVGVFVLSLYYGFFFKKSKKIRNFSICFLAVLILLLIVFWATRFNPFWQNIPGLNRFTGTSIIPKDGSVQTRLVTWQMSLEAFKAKPIFGWGPDNYLIAWDKYYNFKLATYGETWLDRAHNQLLDTLVMQGIFGLLIYLSLFGFIFYLLFRKKILGGISPILGAVLIAYFVQNIFLFDEISSYLLFIAVIGFMISAVLESKQEENSLEKERIFFSRQNKKYIVSIFGGALSILILYSLYFYNYIPYRQGGDIQKARGGQKDFVRAQLIKSFYPYNFAQPSIRGYITDFYYTDRPYIFENDDFKMLSDIVLDSIQEVLVHDSFDPRFYIRQYQIFDLLGERNPELYRESEKAIRKAMKLAPNRQELWHNLAISLAKQNRFDEAIAISRKTKDLNSAVGRTHFFLAFLLSAESLEKNRAEIVFELDKMNELDPGLESLQPMDAKKIPEIYLKLQEYDRLANFVMKKVNSMTAKIFEPQYYEFALKYFLAKRDSENFIKIADFVGKEIPAQKENMDGLADLARKGLWQILDTLP